jgi:hypothetical protein
MQLCLLGLVLLFKQDAFAVALVIQRRSTAWPARTRAVAEA